MALQTSVPFTQAIGLPGSIDATNSYTINPYYADSGVTTPVAGDPANLYLGCGVFKKLGDPTASTAIPGKTGLTAVGFAGFIARNAVSENAILSGTSIANGNRIGVLNNGHIFVVSKVAITFGTDRVHLIINDADPTNIGKITNATVSADVIDISTYVELMGSTTGADQIVKVNVSKL